MAMAGRHQPFAKRGNIDLAAITRCCALWPGEGSGNHSRSPLVFFAFAHQPQRLSVIFSSFFKKQECLLWKRPAGKHRYEVLPTGAA